MEMESKNNLWKKGVSKNYENRGTGVSRMGTTQKYKRDIKIEKGRLEFQGFMEDIQGHEKERKGKIGKMK